MRGRARRGTGGEERALRARRALCRAIRFALASKLLAQPVKRLAQQARQEDVHFSRPLAACNLDGMRRWESQNVRDNLSITLADVGDDLIDVDQLASVMSVLPFDCLGLSPREPRALANEFGGVVGTTTRSRRAIMAERGANRLLERPRIARASCNRAAIREVGNRLLRNADPISEFFGRNDPIAGRCVGNCVDGSLIHQPVY